MKTIWTLLLVFIAACTVCGSIPSVSVTVCDENGKIVYHGSTKADGVFRTPHLPPGNYVVQFNSDLAVLRKNQYLLVVSAGLKKVIADAVNGEQFAGSGVAMRIRLGQGLNIESQMADESAVSVPGNPYVKIVKGQRYLWVGSLTGSNLGPRWVDETLALERNIVALDKRTLTRIQDRAGEGSLLNRYRGQSTAVYSEYGH